MDTFRGRSTERGAMTAIDTLGLGVVHADGQVSFCSGRAGFYRGAFLEEAGKELAPRGQAGGLYWLGSHGFQTIKIIHKKSLIPPVPRPRGSRRPRSLLF